MDTHLISLYFMSFMYTICHVLSFERLMGVFFTKRRTSLKVTIGSYLLPFSFFCLAVLLSNPWFELFAVLSYLIIPFNYESSMLKRFVAAICSYLCIQMIQGAFIFVMGVFQNDAVNLDINDVALRFAASGVFVYIMTSIFRRFKNIKASTMRLPASWISFLIIPAFSITMVVVQFEFSVEIPRFVGISICIMAVAITTFTFYYQNAISKAYEDKLKAAIDSQEKEYYFAQCQLMQESVDKVKSIHHDMKSHLATARDYIANNKAEVAMAYLNDLLGGISESESYSDTGNIAFDSIINFKLKNILEDGIKLDVKIFVPPTLNIEMADVVTILGNLLDNALDAVAKVEDKRIRLTVESDKGNLFIKIENTFDGVVEYAKDGQAIVTRKDGDKHGYGLKNIRKSVEKYNGHMDIGHDGDVFRVGILLYV